VSAEGRLIAGRYRLQQRIGSGAMGVVWRAVDDRLHRTVAVKQLLLQPGYTDEETEEARQRSMREGRIAARLQHQNAIVVFDVAEDEGQPVLVMEYLPSKSLATMLSEQGPLPPLTVARIGSQVSGALAAAHQAGIVHRDLKPGNVLLGDNGVAKITDFGISRAIGDVSVTKSGILAGTPAYLAPEVALGRDPAPASDVFSLGSTLYAAIEGEPPFGVDENAISLLHRVARGQIEPPRNAGPMTPVLLMLLQPDPVDRPTMAQARNALQAVVEGRPVPGTGSTTTWQQQTTSAYPAPQRTAATRTQVAAPHSPATSVAAAPPAAADSGGSPRFGRAVLLWWTLAILIAIGVGILAANAYGSGKTQSHASPPVAPAKATPPAATAPTAETASNRPATETTTSEPTTETTTVASPPQQPTTQRVLQTVTTYYHLVPNQLDKSWQLLGPSLQAMGLDKYKAFWTTIKDVKILGQPTLENGDQVVLATLQFTTKDGRVSRELHALGMVQSQDGKPLINSDTLVATN
jgi:serine/threonine protein kinase